MNPFEMLKNLNQIKAQAQKFKEELKEIKAEGSSGGGIVKVEINGEFQLLKVSLDPVAVDPRDIKMLEDLIVSAHNDAMDKIKTAIQEKTSSMTGGMDLSDFMGN